ncbi:PREDICTED: uncharacterized protein LOC108759393, partial [Trachymyrmex cornetzi]|uniref:uncharacterized protein LOC108759393 n=1 Tax=Trachymyrmex cornetzi TaxID=471704 RepID=UPI00084F38BD
TFLSTIRKHKASFLVAPVDSTSPSSPIISAAFGPAIACVLKSVSTEISGESGPTSDIQLPAYIKVSAPLLYKPLPRTFPLIYVVSPIVKSASAVAATEPKMLEKDIQYMVNTIYSITDSNS